MYVIDICVCIYVSRCKARLKRDTGSAVSGEVRGHLIPRTDLLTPSPLRDKVIFSNNAVIISIIFICSLVLSQ